MNLRFIKQSQNWDLRWPKFGMSRTSATGVLAATSAMLLLFLQAILGIMLQNGTIWNRRRIRNAHFATMILICALISVHLALNMK